MAFLVTGEVVRIGPHSSDIPAEREHRCDCSGSKGAAKEGSKPCIPLTLAILTKWLRISARILRVWAVRISLTTQKLTCMKHMDGMGRKKNERMPNLTFGCYASFRIITPCSPQTYTGHFSKCVPDRTCILMYLFNIIFHWQWLVPRLRITAQVQ